jgi:succinate dehydrogenase/fumarate reductase flavoprotein subunit
MSGGSFEYLCQKDAAEVLAVLETVRRMAATLEEEFGHLAKDAVDATLGIVRRGEELQEEIDDLKDLWKAVEWWQSGDYGRDRALVELGKWKATRSD